MSILIFTYGLLIGSFLNVCIYRIPAGISIAYPPSSCGSCGHKLTYIDMIPVFNYIFNRGRCRYCGEHYSPQYPAIELLNAALYLLVYSRFGVSFFTLFYCVIVSMLIVITLIDYKHMIIPDGILIFGTAITIIFKFILPGTFVDSLIGCLTGFALFLLIAVVTNAMGGGDIKLMALLGFIFGLKGILFITLCSFVIGAVASIILLITKIKSRKDEVPFGPFISVSALLYILYGRELLAWYVNIFF